MDAAVERSSPPATMAGICNTITIDVPKELTSDENT